MCMLLLWSGVDKTVILWDVATGEMVTPLRGHTDTVYCITYSRDGSMLATGNDAYSTAQVGHVLVSKYVVYSICTNSILLRYFE